MHVFTGKANPSRKFYYEMEKNPIAHRCHGQVKEGEKSRTLDTHCDTECLSKLLDVFKIPLQGFFASGDP